MGDLRIVLVVGHHDDRRALLIELCQQAHDFQSVLRVEVTGRLIGKDQLRAKDDGTRNGYALLLTAGELMREMVGAVGDIHARHYLLDTLLALGLGDAG